MLSSYLHDPFCCIDPYLTVLFIVRYVESSVSEDEQSTWRKSSAPLLTSWETLALHQQSLSTSPPPDTPGVHVNHSVHYFGWDMGIVKLRKTLKIRPNVKSNCDRDSSHLEIEIRRSVRDSGETIMEDLWLWQRFLWQQITTRSLLTRHSSRSGARGENWKEGRMREELGQPGGGRGGHSAYLGK